MPATHEIYDKLCLSFGRFGLTAREVRMTSAQTGDLARNFRIAAEISHLKAWWETSGDDFLQGKLVRNPNLIYVSAGLK